MLLLCPFRKGDRIYHQLKKLGSSLDWDRACFTMDPVSFLHLSFHSFMRSEGSSHFFNRLVS